MLALVGLVTIVAVLAAILSRTLSPLVALAAIPMVASIMLGKTAELGTYMSDGMLTVAPMAAMFLFAMLFFLILADAGLFHPLVDGIVRITRDHPPRVAVGTAILTSVVHLDGSGAATFLIVVPALVPVYDRLGLDRRMLAAIVAMAAGVCNMLPWGGPALRAATALDVSVMELFRPLIPVYAAGLASVLALSWWIGHRHMAAAEFDGNQAPDLSFKNDHVERVPLGWRYWSNAVIVIAVLAAMLTEAIPPAASFMLGTVAAILLNLRGLAEQAAALERHAPAILAMIAILFAAGSFTGILRGSGMLAAMSHGGAALLPPGFADHLPVAMGLTGMPLSLLFDPDSFYFGVLPVIGGIDEASGVPAIAIGRAAVLGQMTTGFPVSPLTPATFLLVGLSGVDLARHQRFAIPYLFALSAVMTAVALALGVFAL